MTNALLRVQERIERLGVRLRTLARPAPVRRLIREVSQIVPAVRVRPHQRPRVNENGVICKQCYRRQPRDHFRTNAKTGEPASMCGGMPSLPGGCREKYRAWSSLSQTEKLARHRPFESDDAYSVMLSLSSKNRKLGDMPATRTARGSCPDNCSFKNAGCYAEFGLLRLWWERTEVRGMSWSEFCRAIAKLKAGQIWRHNEMGDLPGRADAVDGAALAQLVHANKGKRGFTFTHCPVLHSTTDRRRAVLAASNRRAIASAVRDGFTINLSADSLDQADELAELGIAPVSVVVPVDHPRHATKTPGGRQVVICPNETHGMTCGECQLCAVPNRKSIVGFVAHGQSKALVSNIVRSRRSA